MTDRGKGAANGGHFAEEDWVDFARRQVGAEPRDRMQRHLSERCAECSQTARLWSNVVRLSGQEASYRPPDTALRQVKGQFALYGPKPLASRAARFAALLFDSFRQPLPAGVRAAATSSRQLLYKAGRHLVMLRVEPQADSERLSAVGQVIDEANPKQPCRDLAVLILSGTETVARAVTNALGEFQLELDPTDSLRLSVGVPGSEALTVRLPLLGGSGSSAVPRGPRAGRDAKGRAAARRRGRVGIARR